jgi:acylphosphatase
MAYFSGDVQGVGFRFTTLRVAQGYPSVTGTVRNLPDGRVELIAEGEREEVEAMLLDVRTRMGDYIRSVDSSCSDASGEFSGFRISH